MENKNNTIAPVELSKPDPKWVEKFEEAREELEPILGPHVVSIEHMGSTAIPNLSAKPEIDILVGVNKLEDIKECVVPLREIGYLYYKRFEDTAPNRKYFRKSDGITPLVHVHVYEVGDQAYKDHLLFRDYMREHPEAVREYEDLKKRLLESSGGDRGVYQKGKEEFIKRVNKLARENEL